MGFQSWAGTRHIFVADAQLYGLHKTYTVHLQICGPLHAVPSLTFNRLAKKLFGSERLLLCSSDHILCPPRLLKVGTVAIPRILRAQFDHSQ